jgi:hypothetical protein
MTAFHHELERRHALQHAVEEHFGKPSSWTLKTQAAYTQLETMQRLMGDDYAPFMQLAQQAIHRHRTKKSRILYYRRDHLGLLLQPQFPEDSETADLGWALNKALEGLLTEAQYEQMIDAAVEALAPIPAGAH